MTNPKFSTNSLVIYRDGIYQILSISPRQSGYDYKLILVAYRRDMETNEFYEITIPKEIIVEESLLSEFKAKVPKFKFGAGVKLNGINCIVQFIEYKNHSYSYTVREKVHWTDELQGGWRIDESYLQIW